MTQLSQSKGEDTALGNVGRYALRRALARGGMASVYLAHLQGPHGFEKVVAVKRIHPHLAPDRRFVDMFLDEARVAALIHHPNVCAVMDFGEDDGTPYLVMEFLSGESLSSVLKVARAGGGCPLWLGVRIVHDAARGLHAAHELRGPDGRPMGVVHRDVSPQNIFVLYDGVTKVVDFGVARARGRMTVTRTNEVKGKLPYMAPEQYDNDAVDQRADIWALGVVLWEATTGRRLFRASSDAATIARVLHKPIPVPSDFVVDYPARLQEIVMKCLERDPAGRYESADVLADDLESFLYSTGKPAGTSQVKKWMSGHFTERIATSDLLLRGELPEGGLEQELSGSTLSSIRYKIDSSPGDDLNHPPTLGTDLKTATARPGRSLSVPSSWPPGTIRRRSPLRSLALVAAVALAIGTVFGVLYFRGWEAGRPVAASAPHASAPAATAPPPAASPALPAKPPGAPAAAVPTPERPREANGVGASGQAHATGGAAGATEPASSGETAGPSEKAAAEKAAARRAADKRAHRRRAARRHMAPGQLSLLAIPSASVELNGKKIGNTPLIDRALPPGTHRLVLRTADGRQKTVTVRIKSGHRSHLRVEF